MNKESNNNKKIYIVSIFLVSCQIYIQNMFQMIDTFVIGRYDEKAVSAINIATQPINIIRKILFSVVMGYIILCPRTMQEEEKTVSRNLCGMATYIILGISGICMIIIKQYNRQLMEYWLKETDIILYAIKYLNISCYVIVFQNLNILYTAVLRCFEFEKWSLKFNILASVCNLVSDIVIVNIKNENVIENIALSTLLSQILCFVLMFIFIIKNKLITFEFSYRGIKDLLIIGFPSSVDSLIYTIVQSFINTLICEKSSLMLAAYIYMVNFSNILTSISESIGNVMGIEIGKKCGIKKYKEVKQLITNIIGRYAKINIIFIVVWSILFRIVIHILNISDTMKNMMMSFLPFLIVIIYFQAMNICIASLLKSCGDSKYVCITTAIVSIAVKVLIAAIFIKKYCNIAVALGCILIMDEGIRCIINCKRVKKQNLIKTIAFRKEQF